VTINSPFQKFGMNVKLQFLMLSTDDEILELDGSVLQRDRGSRNAAEPIILIHCNMAPMLCLYHLGCGNQKYTSPKLNYYFRLVEFVLLSVTNTVNVKSAPLVPLCAMYKRIFNCFIKYLSLSPDFSHDG
jgi:hypothetical protein